MNTEEPTTEVLQGNLASLQAVLDDATARVRQLNERLHEHRTDIRTFYTLVNDYIEAEELEEDGDIPLSALEEIVEGIWKSKFVYTKEYEVLIRFEVEAAFTIKASSEDEAREIAEQIGMSSDPEYDVDGSTTTLNENVIDEFNVHYVGRI